MRDVSRWLAHACVPADSASSSSSAGRPQSLGASRRRGAAGLLLRVTSTWCRLAPKGSGARRRLPPSERDGFLIGRGASDMKGIGRCDAHGLRAHDGCDAAAPRVTRDAADCRRGGATPCTAPLPSSRHCRHAVSRSITVSSASRRRRPATPSRTDVAVRSPGKLRVIGVQGHVAYPERAINPVHRGTPALAELCAIAWDEGDANFGPTTFQVSNIHAGTGAPNVVPGDLVVQFNLRFSVWSIEALQVARGRCARDARPAVRVDWTVSAMPFVTSGDTLTAALRQAIVEVTGVEAEVSTSGGTSDGRFLKTISRGSPSSAR